jgi:hypothetical protein
MQLATRVGDSAPAPSAAAPPPDGGRPLDPATRLFFETRFGHDFGGVRIHTGADASRAARSISALAYTVGSSVVFGDDRYDPASHAGRRLLAHELAHVVQQGAGGAGPAAALAVSPAEHPAEREADRAADRVLSGARGTPSLTPLPAGTGTLVQRQPAPAPAPAAPAPPAPTTGPDPSSDLLDEQRALLGTWGLQLDDADERRLAVDFPQGFHLGPQNLFLFVTTTAERAAGFRLLGYHVVQPPLLEPGVESYIFQVGKGRALLLSSVSGAGSVMLDLGVDLSGQATGAARLVDAVLALTASRATTAPMRALLSHTDADHLNAAFAFLSNPAFSATTVEAAREQLRSAVGQGDWTAMGLNLIPADRVVEIEVTGAGGQKVGPAGAQVHVQKRVIGDFELTEFRSVEAHRRMMDPARRSFDKNATSPVTVVLDLVTGERFLYTADARLRQFTEIVNAIGERAFLRILGAEGRNLRLFEPPHHGGRVQGPDVAGMITALRLAYEAGGGEAHLVMQTSESFIAPGGPSSFRFLEAVGVGQEPVFEDPSPAGTHQAVRARGRALERVTFDTTGIQDVMSMVRARQPVLDAAYTKLGEIRELQSRASLMQEGLTTAGAPDALIQSLAQIRAGLDAREQAFQTAAGAVWTGMREAASGRAGMRDTRDLSGVTARIDALDAHVRGVDLTREREDLAAHEEGINLYGRVFTTLVSMMNALRSRNYQELHRLRGEYEANLTAVRGVLGKRVVDEQVRAAWKTVEANWSPERIEAIARRLGSTARVQRIMENEYRVELLESLTRQAQLNEAVEHAMTGRQSYGPNGVPRIAARTRAGAGVLLGIEAIGTALDIWNVHEANVAADEARAAANRKQGFETVRWWITQGAHPVVGLVKGGDVISDAMPQDQVLDIVAGKETTEGSGTKAAPDYDRAVVLGVPVDDLVFMVNDFFLEAANLGEWYEMNDANPSGGPTFKHFGGGWGVRLWNRSDERYNYFSLPEIQGPLDTLQQQLEAGQQREFEKAIDTSDGMIMGQKDTAWFFGSDRYAYVFNQGGRRERIDFGGTNPRWVRLGTVSLDRDEYALVKAVDLPTYRKLLGYYWREEAGLSADRYGVNHTLFRVFRNVGGFAYVDPDNLTFREEETVAHMVGKVLP